MPIVVYSVLLLTIWTLTYAIVMFQKGQCKFSSVQVAVECRYVSCVFVYKEVHLKLIFNTVDPDQLLPGSILCLLNLIVHLFSQGELQYIFSDVTNLFQFLFTF
jgi:hypothetical protein